MDSRVAIVGQNGTGKSTLLNLITGALNPVEGTVQRHAGLKLGKYSQHSADQLPYDKSPLEYMESKYKEKFPEKDLQFWRGQLGRFRSFRCSSNFGHSNALGWSSQPCRLLPTRHGTASRFTAR